VAEEKAVVRYRNSTGNVAEGFTILRNHHGPIVARDERKMVS